MRTNMILCIIIVSCYNKKGDFMSDLASLKNLSEKMVTYIRKT